MPAQRSDGIMSAGSDCGFLFWETERTPPDDKNIPDRKNESNKFFHFWFESGIMILIEKIWFSVLMERIPSYFLTVFLIILSPNP